MIPEIKLSPEILEEILQEFHNTVNKSSGHGIPSIVVIGMLDVVKFRLNMEIHKTNEREYLND